MLKLGLDALGTVEFDVSCHVPRLFAYIQRERKEAPKIKPSDQPILKALSLPPSGLPLPLSLAIPVLDNHRALVRLTADDGLHGAAGAQHDAAGHDVRLRGRCYALA